MQYRYILVSRCWVGSSEGFDILWVAPDSFGEMEDGCIECGMWRSYPLESPYLLYGLGRFSLLVSVVSNMVLEPCLIEGHEFKPHCTFISLFIELRASPKEVVCDMFSYGPVCLFMYGFPLYYHMKFAFLVWLQLPSTDVYLGVNWLSLTGAGHLYMRHLRPFLLRHQAKLDQIMGLLYGEMGKKIIYFRSAKTLGVRLRNDGVLAMPNPFFAPILSSTNKESWKPKGFSVLKYPVYQDVLVVTCLDIEWHRFLIVSVDLQAKFISLHQAEIQLARTFVMKVLAGGMDVNPQGLFRDIIHSDVKQVTGAIEGPTTRRTHDSTTTQPTHDSVIENPTTGRQTQDSESNHEE
ncbi:HVA22-like protein k [Vitis vinifera]|uniref:HVA22-like protein k n=1 Tax=Vitis vinifera TaxID=29760 RepID=A0A438JTZ1_VITVI|nr:HVA22-like protein k [Vitis vinifera]